MTTVKFFMRGEYIYAFEAEGHSGYAENEYDIVCAAISTSFSQTNILIEDVLGIICATEINPETARVYFELPDDMTETESKNVQNAILACKIYLTEVAEQYNDYINILEVQQYA